eukprot:8897920-Pyramimonas_sp.AAC.1
MPGLSKSGTTRRRKDAVLVLAMQPDAVTPLVVEHVRVVPVGLGLDHRSRHQRFAGCGAVAVALCGAVAVALCGAVAVDLAAIDEGAICGAVTPALCVVVGVAIRGAVTVVLGGALVVDLCEAVVSRVVALCGTA